MNAWNGENRELESLFLLPPALRHFQVRSLTTLPKTLKTVTFFFVSDGRWHRHVPRRHYEALSRRRSLSLPIHGCSQPGQNDVVSHYAGELGFRTFLFFPYYYYYFLRRRKENVSVHSPFCLAGKAKEHGCISRNGFGGVRCG